MMKRILASRFLACKIVATATPECAALGFRLVESHSHAMRLGGITLASVSLLALSLIWVRHALHADAAIQPIRPASKTQRRNHARSRASRTN